jgi:hypothetical protein
MSTAQLGDKRPQPPHSQGPPPAFVVSFSVSVAGVMDGWVVNLILGVVYGIKANRGEWATYPIFGKWLLLERASSAK